MTPEQKKQLDRAILMQRLKVIIPSVIVVALVFGGYAWVTAEKVARVDRTVESYTVAGHVAGAARLTGRRGAYRLHVRLDGGGEVEAVSALPQPPHDGEAVELRVATHASGRVTYQVVRLVN
jgi:hypothetical protein